MSDNVIQFPRESKAPVDVLQMAMDRIDDIVAVILFVTMEDGTTHIRHSEQTTGSLALAALHLQQEALKRSADE